MILTVLLLTVASTCLAQPADNNAQQRPARAPRSQIQYKDPDGLRVDWKFYAPENQWKSEQANMQRAQRAETGTGQANFGSQKQSRVVQAPAEPEAQYQPYSALPNHIKQLLAQSYTPQGPYVDPAAFFYQSAPPIAAPSGPQTREDHTAYPQSQLEREYFNSAITYTALGNRQSAQHNSQQIGRIPSRQGGIKYKDEDRASEKNTQLPYGSVISAQSQAKSQYQPYKQISQPQYQRYNKQASTPQPQYQAYNKQASQPQSQYQAFNKQAPQPQPQYQAFNKQTSRPQQYQQYKTSEDTEVQTNLNKHMPMAIQQLLNYQAQLPYNVIANHILYRPKEPFIPKPLPESEKLARQYPSKIYFVKADGQVYESPDTVKDAGSEKRY